MRRPNRGKHATALVELAHEPYIYTPLHQRAGHHYLSRDYHVTHHAGPGVAAFLYLVIVMLLTLTVTAVIFAGQAVADHAGGDVNPTERTVDLEPPLLNAIARCESGGRADAHNPVSTASGLFQFLTTTWDRTALLNGRPALVGVNATEATLAQQIRMATDLFASSGSAPWNASRHCWAGASTRPLVVSHDRPTRTPNKCRQSMHNRWHYSWRQSWAICAQRTDLTLCRSTMRYRWHYTRAQARALCTTDHQQTGNPR